MSPSNPALNSTSRECWLPSLQLALQEVFDLMLACRLEVGPELHSEEGLEITAIVGLAGQLRGIMIMRCSAKSAARMASRMLGIEAEQAVSAMWDAVGEICNMVAGNFKNKIAGLGDGCMLSVPTVVTGTEYDLHSMVDDEMHIIFLFEGEPILLSLEIHN
jgi:chemotaxis protein CheX